MNPKSSLTRQMIISAIVVAIFAVLGLGLVGKARSENKESAPPPSGDVVSVSKEGAKAADIELGSVQSRAIKDTIHATGQVLYSPDLTVKVSPRLQGRVREVFARVGDHVLAGQTLAIIDSVDAVTAATTDRQNQNALRLAALNLQKAQRQFQLGTPEVTQAEATLDQAKTQVLSTKDVLDKARLQNSIGGFTQKPLEDAENALVSAKSTLSQSQSDLIAAQKDYDRKVKLVAIGVAPQSDLESSTDTLEKTRTNVEAGKDTVRLAQQAVDREQKAFKSNLYADQQVNQAQFNYQQAKLQQSAAERALLLSKAAVRTALDQARSDYQTAVYNAQNSRVALSLLGEPSKDGTVAIKSPISGVVTERFVGPGQVVDQSQMTPWQMFTLANSDRVWVEASVYEKDLSAVAEGMPVTIHVGALANQVFRGTVLHIAPALDRTTRAIKVRADIDNRLGLLKDGMYATIDIHLPNGRQETTVPLVAVQHDADSDYVYVVENGKYIKRMIHLSAQKDGLGIVESGVKPGERIVTHGAIYLGADVSGD